MDDRRVELHYDHVSEVYRVGINEGDRVDPRFSSTDHDRAREFAVRLAWRCRIRAIELGRQSGAWAELEAAYP